MATQEPISSDPKPPEIAPTKQYKGINGWLILPGIGLIVTPFLLAYTIYQTIMLFSSGTWDAITTPGSEQYIPNIAPVAIAELLLNIFTLCFSLILLYLFFKESRSLPKLIIIFYAFTILYMITDSIIGSMVLGIPIDFGGESIRTIVIALIWIPYFKMSKRVKQTFVN